MEREQRSTVTERHRPARPGIRSRRRDRDDRMTLDYTAAGSLRRSDDGVLCRLSPHTREAARRRARAPMTRLPLAASQAVAEVSPPIGNSDPPFNSGSAPNSDATGAPHEAVRNSIRSESTLLRYVALTGTSISATAAASRTRSETASRGREDMAI